MVAEPVIWVDVEAAVRSWARAAVTERTFFGTNDKVVDQLVLRRIGGPDSECLIQFDCWAATKAAAAALAASLATEADAIARYETGGVMLHAAVVESSRWLPDPENDRPRYVVDVTFMASASTTSGS